jgi:ubiquinone/menaquinone biosynthesis C-methylase UbiE
MEENFPFFHFGINARHYSHGRRGYPLQVFSYLKVLIDTKDSILDLGCGTGISTRQLVIAGFEDVSGIDYDAKMLEVAQEFRELKSIPYYKASISKLPFKSRSIKALTCFSSFHWFNDDPSVKEMRRVLKEGGLVYAVHKRDIRSFQEPIKKLIEEKLNTKFPEVHAEEKIEEGFKKLQFKREPVTIFEAEDFYSVEEAAEYMQSVSFWSLIPESSRDQILEEIIVPYLQQNSQMGKISRHYEVVCQAARKP